MNTVVIADHHLNKDTEWGISLTNHNPVLEDYIGCATEADAFKLQKLLSGLEKPEATR